ncbi:hypothetical protein [Oceanobacillus massiliensis]|uniref:hypothetical protein n=1 Tax=Oceanobacillus massiliensis TaxID=1465765 RepID=UPI00301817D3
MSGFKSKKMNLILRESNFQLLQNYIIKCCTKMNDDCKEGIRNKLFNHEDKIKNRLIEFYLDNKENQMSLGLPNLEMKFDPEISESYDVSTDQFIGRTDIRISNKDIFHNRNLYYIIECKRINGNAKLNKAYVTEGIARFVEEKYYSGYGRNFMLAFEVKKLNRKENIDKIKRIQYYELRTYISEEFLYIEDKEDYSILSGKYNLGQEKLELRHIFYDFSEALTIN